MAVHRCQSYRFLGGASSACVQVWHRSFEMDQLTGSDQSLPDQECLGPAPFRSRLGQPFQTSLGAKPGIHKTSVTLSEQLIGRVRSDLGLAVNLHLYRHLAAWFYLQARPGDYETIRRLLGHKSIQTTINYYIEIDQLMISRNFNAVLDDLRSRPLPR